MPKQKKLPKTRWYQAAVHPVRNGWYQAKGDLIKNIRLYISTGIVWRYWNGQYWEWCRCGGRNGERVRAGLAIGDSWRGLSRDPNAKERK